MFAHNSFGRSIRRTKIESELRAYKPFLLAGDFIQIFYFSCFYIQSSTRLIMSDDEDYFYGTSSSWSGCYGDVFASNYEERDYSEEFELEGRPGVKFALFYHGEEYDIGLVMQENLSGERVKLDIEIWVENYEYIKSGKIKGKLKNQIGF
jgi:hypothetical protein